jgi:predicted O-methyltransferase YrrM
MKLSKLLPDSIYQFLLRRYVSPSIVDVTEKSKRNGVVRNAQEAIDLLFTDEAKFITPWQHRPEITALAELMEHKRPKVAVEIGTAAGGTLFLTACLAAEDALIVSIDLPHGMYGGGYPEWKIPLYENFARKGQKIELIRGDSHSDETFSKLQSILRGHTIDYLFIDGDHTYEGVKTDFYRYGALMSADGLVAFHDIVPDRSEVPDHFVSVFWDEIKDDYDHHEFIQDPAQSKLGLGALLLKNGIVAEKV